MLFIYFNRYKTVMKLEHKVPSIERTIETKIDRKQLLLYSNILYDVID